MGHLADLGAPHAWNSGGFTILPSVPLLSADPAGSGVPGEEARRSALTLPNEQDSGTLRLGRRGRWPCFGKVELRGRCSLRSSLQQRTTV